MALVVFLRGVNVGGHRTFRPSTLAKELQRYGAVNIGAAGTLIIRRPTNQQRLRAELRKRLPFETEIMMCAGRDLVKALSDPFGAEPLQTGVVRFVSVLARRPRVVPSMPISVPEDGDWLVKIIALEGRFLFGMYRRHMKTVGYLGKIDKLIGVPGTTRNWNTVTSIINELKAGRLIQKKAGM